MTRLILALLTLCVVMQPVVAAEKPNILLICVDDLKPLLGCYGDRTVKSPNIDRLAARGLLFEKAYCNQAVCSPSRNSLLTGLRPQTIGIYDLPTHFRVGAPDAVTLPEHFKRNGYRTQGLGKIYHVGHGNIDDKRSWSVPSWRPKALGYALKATQEDLRKRVAKAKEEGVTGSRLPRGPATESADVPDTTYGDGKIADEAIARLRESTKRKEPFFLAVGFLKPHLPFVAPKKYWDLYDRSAFKLASYQKAPNGAPSYAPQNSGELRQYSDMPKKGPIPAEQQRLLIHGYHAATSYMDAQLGRILDELDRLSLQKNTIIVLWGDHGWHLGDHGMWCKHTNYEQAARIPVIVAAPGVTKAGTRTAALIETVDIYPTLNELAGLPVRKELDGKSFVSVLKDPASKTHDAIIHVYPRGQRLGRAIRTDRYRLVEWKAPGAKAGKAEFELYDYEKDPQEMKNIAKENPEIATQLKAILRKHPEAKAPVKK